MNRTFEAADSLIKEVRSDTATDPAYILMGRLTWAELYNYFIGCNPAKVDINAPEIRGIPIIVDPSREHYIQAIQAIERTDVTASKKRYVLDESDLDPLDIIYVPEIYNGSPMSIYLAGPTPRSSDVVSWRPQFINLLRKAFMKKQRRIAVLVPENEDGVFKQDYLDQVEWEHDHMLIADTIVFWMPRDLETLPGFTSNVEFGYWLPHDGNFYYGRPEGAPKTKYLDWLYKKHTNREPATSMQQLIDQFCKAL